VWSRSRQFGTSAEVSERHFGTSAELSGHFGTSAELSGHFGTSLMVPKCRVRSVLGPKCLDTVVVTVTCPPEIVPFYGTGAVWWVWQSRTVSLLVGPVLSTIRVRDFTAGCQLAWFPVFQWTHLFFDKSCSFFQ